jgi:archaellum component FlaC
MATFKLNPISQILTQQPKNNWLVKSIIEKASAGMIFGPPGSAKSFIAMDMAFCIATGNDFAGNHVNQGKVVYLAGEGLNGLGKRFKALEEKYQTKASNLFSSNMPASLICKKNTEEVIKEVDNICPNPSLIIVDTLHRNFGGGDENSAKDVGKLMEAITAIINHTGAAVLLVHHSGHNSGDRARGSSALKAALDVEYKISKKNNAITMKNTKVKDFDEPKPISFNLISQTISGWLDESGRPLKSAILELNDGTTPRSKVLLSKRDSGILNALEVLIKDKGKQLPQSAINVNPLLSGKSCIDVNVWRTEVYQLLDADKLDQQAKQKAFKRAREKFEKGKIVIVTDDFYCLS